MNTGEILIYQNQEGNIKIDVRLEEETVWLTQSQLCELFQKSKSTISEHIKNIFEEGELNEKVVVRKFRTTTPHGAIANKTQKTNQILQPRSAKCKSVVTAENNRDCSAKPPDSLRLATK